MNRQLAPSTVAPPAANYALAVKSEGAVAWLHTSGIVGVRADGSLPRSIEDQAEVIWATLLAILAEAGMEIADVVSITTYVVADQRDALPKVMAARDGALQGHRVASTLLTVPALARPEWKVEIALIAAR